jgi:hypothetical protein
MMNKQILINILKNILLLGTLSGLFVGFYISLLLFIPDYFFGANIFGGNRERIIFRILGALSPFIVLAAIISTVYLLKRNFKPNLVHLISVCLITMMPVLAIIMGEADDIHIISALGGLVGFISSIPFVLFYLIIGFKMHSILKNVLVFLIGCISGQYVSTFLGLMLKIFIVGGFAVNLGEPAAWEIKYFLIPFFAHAGGTLAGAFIVAKHTVTHHMILSIVVGALFLFRNLSYLLTMPLWFVLSDISLAYIPMGWLGWKLTGQDK